MKFRTIVVMTGLSLLFFLVVLAWSLVQEGFRSPSGASQKPSPGQGPVAATGPSKKSPTGQGPVAATGPSKKPSPGSLWQPVSPASSAVKARVYPPDLRIPVLWYGREYLGYPQPFASQAGYLADMAIGTVTLPELASARQGTGTLPGKAVALVFSGRVGEFYTHIYPVLQQHRLKATLITPASQHFAARMTFAVTRYLRLGSTGAKVRELQECLHSLGYPLVADGRFGPRTRRAIIRFQQDYHLLVDGIVGPQTVGQINCLLGQGQELGASPLVALVTEPVNTITKLTVPYPLGREDFAQLLEPRLNWEDSIDSKETGDHIP